MIWGTPILESLQICFGVIANYLSRKNDDSPWDFKVPYVWTSGRWWMMLDGLVLSDLESGSILHILQIPCIVPYMMQENCSVPTCQYRFSQIVDSFVQNPSGVPTTLLSPGSLILENWIPHFIYIEREISNLISRSYDLNTTNINHAGPRGWNYTFGIVWDHRMGLFKSHDRLRVSINPPPTQRPAMWFRTVSTITDTPALVQLQELVTCEDLWKLGNIYII